jgi:ABC-type antimicrobial peptide transport system permease subunit
MIPAAVGAAAGIVLAVAGTRVLSGMLYQVDPWDPITFVSGTILLFAVALLASVIPAWSALRISPTEAIRAE